MDVALVVGVLQRRADLAQDAVILGQRQWAVRFGQASAQGAAADT